nr:hypothetical protein [Bartonella doshiae]
MCETVAPALAARVAANFRNPCADFFIPAALHASRKRLPKLSFEVASRHHHYICQLPMLRQILH